MIDPHDFCQFCGERHSVRIICDEPDDAPCSGANGHEWEFTGTAYGGDDPSYFGEGRCYCIWCGADGDA